MPYQVFDLNPVDRITTDAIGQPGSRVFYLQARQGGQLVTLICEKEHVAGLAEAIDRVLMSLADDDIDAVVEPDPIIEQGMARLRVLNEMVTTYKSAEGEGEKKEE